MPLPLRNALADLLDRLHRPLLWAFALGLPFGCILVMVLFAPRAGSALAWETSLCLLAFIPLPFLSPVPWQLRSDRRRLNRWFRALPAHLLLSAVLGPAGTALVIWAMGAPEGFRARFQAFGLEGSLAFWALTLPLGWMQAHATWLQERTAWARAEAEASQWMRHSSSFDPDLLASHLRHLARTAEVAPQSTVDGILALAELYRQWLSLSESPLVALGEERRLLEALVEAEAFRTEGALRVEWLWAPGPVAWKLPPCTLFSLASLMVASGARHLSFGARLLPPGLELSIEGELPPRFTELPVWQGVAARLQQCLGPGARLEADGAGVVLRLPGMAS